MSSAKISRLLEQFNSQLDNPEIFKEQVASDFFCSLHESFALLVARAKIKTTCSSPVHPIHQTNSNSSSDVGKLIVTHLSGDVKIFLK